MTNAATSDMDAFAHARRAGVRVFGAGGFARDLVRALQQAQVPVLGFVTSQMPTTARLDDLPVQALAEAELGGSALFVGVFNREAHSDYGVLAQLLHARWPQARIVWPQASYAALSAALGFRFWLQDPALLADAADECAKARAALDDEASREAFDRVLAFRGDARAFHRPAAPDPGTQYLPDWLRQHCLRAGRGELNLVDAGAYRGETLQALAQHLTVAQAWTFEPDPANHQALVRQLADWPRALTHIPAGLSSSGGQGMFTVGQGESSRLVQGTGDDAGVPVTVVALDECLHRAPVNFIKLDVEGHELAALQGAMATLQRQRPVLAIAAYHRWDDLWRIPAFLQRTGLGYRLRLGLHGHNSFDTVLYAF